MENSNGKLVKWKNQLNEKNWLNREFQLKRKIG